MNDLKVLFLAGAIALASLAGATGARAATDSLGDDSQACQKCHDKPDAAMRTQDGKPLSLYVSTDAYLKSRHGANDCTDCHDGLDDKHATDKPAVKSRRDHALALNDGCKSCHKKLVVQFADSVHAALARDGSSQAPLCSDCHAVHSVRSTAEEASKDTCFGCHRNAAAQHASWLPNTGRHFEAIACAVCHAPAAERRVSLRMYDQKGRRHVAETSGVPRFERLVAAADEHDRGLDERALWSLLQEFNRDGAQGDVVLRGRLEVRQGAQAHQLAPKSRAISDCDTCHRAGAAAFQSVVLTIAGPDGRPLRHGVDNQVLNSLKAIDSVRGFYAIGATRIKLLDVLLALVVASSVGGVLAHMGIKWATRRIRARIAAENGATPK